ncbi:MAG: tetratricopeptide repeat protein [Pyrinomonadaceae bacterium]
MVLLIVVSLPAAAAAQGSGREATGNGGNHIIQGKIFFPSGRRAEGNIQIKLQSFGEGEISTIADSSGSFIFTSLLPGNYTIVINAGDEYEIAREGVTIDSDLNLSRSGVSLNSGSRRYTVMVTLQVKASNRAKPSVVNATLAEVPQDARALYEKALQLGKSGEPEKAIDSLRAALSLFPRFPLALNELGVQYLIIGQAAKAVEPLKSASKLVPDAFSPKLNLGIALLETGQIPEAEAQLRDALRITSTPTVHMYLGLTLIRAKRFDEARAELETAIAGGGGNLAQAHKFLGGIYWQKHEYRRAVEEFEAYLRLTPNAPDAERIRGTINELRAKI